MAGRQAKKKKEDKIHKPGFEAQYLAKEGTCLTISLLTLLQSVRSSNGIWLKDKMHWSYICRILCFIQLLYRVLQEKTRPSRKEIYNSVPIMDKENRFLKNRLSITNEVVTTF